MNDNKIWVVISFNDAEDCAIECVCDTKESAEVQAESIGLINPSWSFQIRGGFSILSLGG